MRWPMNNRLERDCSRFVTGIDLQMGDAILNAKYSGAGISQITQAMSCRIDSALAYALNQRRIVRW